MNRRLPAVLSALAIVPFAAACGDDDESETAIDGSTTPVAQTEPGENGSGSPEGATPQALARAADKTTGQGAVRMALKGSITLMGSQVPTTGSGVIDPKAQRGSFTVNQDFSKVPGLGAVMPGGGKLSQKVAFDKLTFFISSDLFKMLPGNKEWVKFDLQKLGKTTGIDLNSLTQGAGADPTQALQYLRGASKDIREVGKEDVRGEPTTHYRATVALDKVIASAPAAQREAIRKSVEQLKKLGGATTVPIEVWVAEDGTVRRIRQKIDQKIQGQAMSIDTTTELYDFGTKEPIELPADSETQDLMDILPGGGGSGGPGGLPGLGGALGGAQAG